MDFQPGLLTICYELQFVQYVTNFLWLMLTRWLTLARHYGKWLRLVLRLGDRLKG
jgi:hypothetical protein